MKFSELQSKSQPELQEMLKKTRTQLGELRFKMSNGALKDHSQIGKTKKDIAKIMTAIKSQNI